MLLYLKENTNTKTAVDLFKEKRYTGLIYEKASEVYND